MKESKVHFGLFLRSSSEIFGTSSEIFITSSEHLWQPITGQENLFSFVLSACIHYSACWRNLTRSLLTLSTWRKTCISECLCNVFWNNCYNQVLPDLVCLQKQQLIRSIEDIKTQLSVSQDKLHRQAQEAGRRDEQIVLLKVELATLQEKHRLIQDEVRFRFESIKFIQM